MKKICVNCQSEFNAEVHKAKFCGRKCFDEYRIGRPMKKRAQVVIVCKGCNKEFSVYQSWGNRRFCSMDCKREFYKKPDKIYKEIFSNCGYCGKQFSYIKKGSIKQKYCSGKCRAAYWYRIRISKCKNCGKPFSEEWQKNIRDKFCNKKCRDDFQRKNGKITKRNGVRRYFNRRGLIIKCDGCGYDKHPEILGVHHKDENPENHALDNLIVLCPNCHSLRHHKFINH